jgi:hypothetical protein
MNSTGNVETRGVCVLNGMVQVSLTEVTFEHRIGDSGGNEP